LANTGSASPANTQPVVMVMEMGWKRAEGQGREEQQSTRAA